MSHFSTKLSARLTAELPAVSMFSRVSKRQSYSEQVASDNLFHHTLVLASCIACGLLFLDEVLVCCQHVHTLSFLRLEWLELWLVRLIAPMLDRKNDHETFIIKSDVKSLLLPSKSVMEREAKTKHHQWN